MVGVFFMTTIKFKYPHSYYATTSTGLSNKFINLLKDYKSDPSARVFLKSLIEEAWDETYEWVEANQDYIDSLMLGGLMHIINRPAKEHMAMYKGGVNVKAF